MGILFFMCSSPSAVHSSPEIWELAHKTRCLWEDQYPSMLPRKKLFSFFSVNNKSPGVAWQLQSVPQHIFPSLIHVSWQSLGDTSEKWTLSNLILNLLIPGEDAKGSNPGQSPQRTTPRCYLSPQPLLLAEAPRGPHQLPATAVTLASWMTAVRAACHTSTTQTKPVRRWEPEQQSHMLQTPAALPHLEGFESFQWSFLTSHSHPGRAAPGIPGCGPGKVLCMPSVCLISGLQQTYAEPPVSLYISLKGKIAHLQVGP